MMPGSDRIACLSSNDNGINHVFLDREVNLCRTMLACTFELLEHMHYQDSLAAFREHHRC
jgi:hypothetical protein